MHTLGKKATIRQVTTMLATSKNVLFPSHNHPANHWYWWPCTWITTLAPASEVSSVPVVSRWVTFLEVASMVVTWWILMVLCSDIFSWPLPSPNKHTLTLKVLNFWKFTSYCSLKPIWSGMGEVVPARTSPTLHPPSPPTVHQLSRLAL